MAKGFPQITKQQIDGLFLQAVKNFPNNKNFSVNTFAHIDSGKAMQSENLGHTYDSYLKGEFWARNWVANGAPQSHMKKQYPILGIEQKKSTRPDICGREKCYEYDIVMLDILTCSNCSDWKKDRTPYQIDCDLGEVLDNIIQEILTVKQYKFWCYHPDHPNDEDEMFEVIVLMSEGEYEQFILDNPGKPVQIGNEILGLIKNTSTTFNSWGRGYASHRGISTKLTFCGCIETKKKFNYGKHEPKKYVGITECEIC